MRQFRASLLSAFALFALTAPVSADAFSANGLAVIQISNANAVTLREFSYSGAAVQSIAVPATGAAALTMSFSATSEGALTISQDGRYLGFAGYRTGTNSSGTDRVIARVDLRTGSTGVDPMIDTNSAIANSEGYTGNNIRGAVWDGDRYWAAGTGSSSSGGTRTNTLGTTSGSTQVSTSVTNTRSTAIFNGQLYTSAMSGAFRGISTVGTGLPTGSGNSTTLLPGFDPATDSPESAYAFFFANATTLYVADDRSAANGGGIQKWVFNSGTGLWELAYTLATGGTTGARGVTGFNDGTNFILYATTADASANRLVIISDTGSGAAFTTLATAATNTIFRGVSVVPEPTSLALCGLAGVGFAGAAFRRLRKRPAAV